MQNVKGKVKYFDTRLGYGFIEVDGEDRDILVHYTVIRAKNFKNLKKGQEVIVDYIEHDSKLMATKVVAKRCN